MEKIRLLIRSRERNTECDEMDWNLKQLEKKINELVERVTEYTEKEEPDKQNERL